MPKETVGEGDGDLPDLDKQSANANAEQGCHQTPEQTAELSISVDSSTDEQPLPTPPSPKKAYLSRTASSFELCRVCQQEKEEVLIDLGCRCRGGLAKAHRTCIDTWFRTRGSNKCEICQDIAANVPSPDYQPCTNYWVWRIESNFRHQGRERHRFSPLWMAFSILICGLLLDVLISITLGISALPFNIIIGVIIVLGLGTGLRVALDLFHEWSLRRVAQRVETDANLGYHPALLVNLCTRDSIILQLME